MKALNKMNEFPYRRGPRELPCPFCHVRIGELCVLEEGPDLMVLAH